MPNEAQVIMRRYQPRKYGDYWWVDIGDGVRQFDTADSAREFIRGKRDRANRCLYYGCLLEGELMAQGVGFRFCRNHVENARRVLENPLVDPKRRRR